ncbi:unnamed protein product, partial [marine sediment metagenome]
RRGRGGFIRPVILGSMNRTPTFSLTMVPFPEGSGDIQAERDYLESA